MADVSNSPPNTEAMHIDELLKIPERCDSLGTGEEFERGSSILSESSNTDSGDLEDGEIVDEPSCSTHPLHVPQAYSSHIKPVGQFLYELVPDPVRYAQPRLAG